MGSQRNQQPCRHRPLLGVDGAPRTRPPVAAFPPITSKFATKTWSQIRAKHSPSWAASSTTISTTITSSTLPSAPLQNQFFLSRRGQQEKINPLGRWKERLSTGEHRRHRRHGRPVSRRKRLPAFAPGRPNGAVSLRVLVDALDVSRVPRQQTLAQDKHAGGPLRQCFRAGTRGRPPAIADASGS